MSLFKKHCYPISFRDNSHDTIWSTNERMNKLLENFLGDFQSPATKMVSDFSPHVEVKEDKVGYFVEVDLPGLKSEEVDLSFDNKTLFIKGERKNEKNQTDENRKTHYSERFYGSFLRAIPLPDEVVEDKISADFQHGVLKVHLPKRPVDSVGKKSISIKNIS